MIPTPDEAAKQAKNAYLNRRLEDIARDLRRTGGRHANIIDTEEVCQFVAAALRERKYMVHVGRRPGKKGTEFRLTAGTPHDACNGSGCEACESTGITPG